MRLTGNMVKQSKYPCHKKAGEIKGEKRGDAAAKDEQGGFRCGVKKRGQMSVLRGGAKSSLEPTRESVPLLLQGDTTLRPLKTTAVMGREEKGGSRLVRCLLTEG